MIRLLPLLLLAGCAHLGIAQEQTYEAAKAQEDLAESQYQACLRTKSSCDEERKAAIKATGATYRAIALDMKATLDGVRPALAETLEITDVINQYTSCRKKHRWLIWRKKCVY